MTTGKRTWFIFQHGEGFIEMQLIYLIDIFDNDYNFLRDCFETDSANVIKNRCLAAKKQTNFGISIYISLAQSIKKTIKIVIRNNDTQNVRKPYWFVANS